MSQTYNPSTYQPSRGGHAHSHAREAFRAAVEVYELWNDGEPEPELEVGPERKLMMISEICGLVWNCTDAMPSWLRDQIDSFWAPLPYHDVRVGSSYAAGARRLKELIAHSR